MAEEPDADWRVFLNIPYDRAYISKFLAPLTFAILSCSFRPCIAADVNANDREARIAHLIRTCNFSISDVSPRWVEDSGVTAGVARRIARRQKLPRYNMAYELGRFMAHKHIDGAAIQEDHSGPAALILTDSSPYDVDHYFSDIRNRGFQQYQPSIAGLVDRVCEWLAPKLVHRNHRMVPNAVYICNGFRAFSRLYVEKGYQERLRSPDSYYESLRADMIYWMNGRPPQPSSWLES